MNKKKNKYLYYLYRQLLVLCFMVFAVAILCLVFNGSINSIIIPIAYLLSIIVEFVIDKEKNIKRFIITEIVVLLIILLSAIVSNSFYDVSWDGTGYHQNAIIELNNGWNPIYEKLTGSGSLWNNYYGKYPEIVQACILATFKSIEMGKMINIIFIVMSTLYTAYILLEKFKFKNFTAVIYSLIIGFNPVAVYQMFSFYNDGILASILIIIGCIVLDLNDKSDCIEKYICLIMVCSIASNIKFTLLGYVFAIGGMYTLYFLINKKDIRKLLISAVMILIIGVGFLGFNPYMINLKEGNNIFYPLLGTEKVDIMTHNQPKSFANKGWTEKFLISLFSESDNINYASNREPTIKIPFTVKQKEIELFKIPDTRIAGWGPLFSGILILSLVIFIRGKYEKKLISIFILGIIITILINPEAWWARYTPQLYIIPIIVFLVFVYDMRNLKKEQKYFKLKNVISAMLIILCILNISLITYTYIESNIKSTKLISSELNKLRNEKIEIYVESDVFEKSSIRKLQENDIDYKIISEKDENRKWIPLTMSRGTIYYSTL